MIYPWTVGKVKSSVGWLIMGTGNGHCTCDYIFGIMQRQHSDGYGNFYINYTFGIIQSISFEIYFYYAECECHGPGHQFFFLLFFN